MMVETNLLSQSREHLVISKKREHFLCSSFSPGGSLGDLSTREKKSSVTTGKTSFNRSPLQFGSFLVVSKWTSLFSQVFCFCQDWEWKLHARQGQLPNPRSGPAHHSGICFIYNIFKQLTQIKGKWRWTLFLAQCPALLLMRCGKSQKRGKIQGAEKLHCLPAHP